MSSPFFSQASIQLPSLPPSANLVPQQNAFSLIMSSNQSDKIKRKNILATPKQKPNIAINQQRISKFVTKTKRINEKDFGEDNEDLEDLWVSDSGVLYLFQGIEQPSNQRMLEETSQNQGEKPKSFQLQIVQKFGYSNLKLNPSSDNGKVHELEMNPLALKYWYYSLGQSFRDYQFNIVRTCLSYNTLVALPTGLGKTFVAANVILNYYLWFPHGKIFFLAPTRPLVNQQIDCLKKFKEIKQSDIFEMTGNFPIPKRSAIYSEKRIFFQTPQTLENDLIERRYQGKDLCLIIFGNKNEAHRATGGYAYVNIIKCFEYLKKQFRVISLSATPGNKFSQIQVSQQFDFLHHQTLFEKEVIKNLQVAKLEMKVESDGDVLDYVHNKQIIPVKITLTQSRQRDCTADSLQSNPETEFYSQRHSISNY